MAQRGAAVLDGATNGRVDRDPGRRRRTSKRRSPPDRRRVHLPELALGVLLVAGGGLGAVLWSTHEPSQRVLVAARPIQRGESIDASMLRWARISGDAINGLQDAAGLSGRIAAVDVAAGAPVQAATFRPPASIGPDEVEYGLAVDAGDFPVGLRVGDKVIVIVVPPADLGGEPVPPVTLAGTAEVLAAPAADLAPGVKAVVNLLLARADAPTLASAADVRLGRVEGT